MATRGISEILITDSGVQAVVGRNKADAKYKVYPVICAQPERKPYSVVRQTSHVPQPCKIGQQVTYDDVYEVTSWHLNYEDAVALDDAVIAALDNYAGTSNGIVFQHVRHIGSNDGEYDNELFSRISTFSAVVDAS